MPSSTSPLEYQSVVVGAAYLVKGIIKDDSQKGVLSGRMSAEESIERVEEEKERRGKGTEERYESE